MLSLLITSTGLCVTKKGSTTPVKPPPLILLPDLVVTTLTLTGSPTKNSEGKIEVPIRVVIKNQGTAEAGIFKVSTEYTVPDGTYAVDFTVPGQSSISYPHTSAPLAAGREISFSGKVTFPASLLGKTVSLMAIADSCSSDEFMPDYCRVKEANEDNNKSTALSVSVSIRLVSPPKPPGLPEIAKPPGPPPVRLLPDLVVKSIKKNGSFTVDSNGDNIGVPIQVVVKNQGPAAAGVFNVAIFYITNASSTKQSISFTVPGQSDKKTPYTSAPLAPGQEVTLDGYMFFPSSNLPDSIYFYAEADSCFYESTGHRYCRVEESNEQNNSSDFSNEIQLPKLPRRDVWVIPNINIHLELLNLSKGDARIQRVRKLCTKFNDRLYDATDGQIRVAKFSIFDTLPKTTPGSTDSVPYLPDGWGQIFDGNYNCNCKNPQHGGHTGWPGFLFPDSRPNDPSHFHVRLHDNDAQLRQQSGTMFMEWCHSYTGALDEYHTEGGSVGSGVCPLEESVRIADNACIMYQTGPYSELCRESNHNPHTDQGEVRHMSCYQWIARVVHDAGKGDITVPFTHIPGPENTPNPSFELHVSNQ